MSPTTVVAFDYPRKKLTGRKSLKPLSTVTFVEKFGNPPGELSRRQRRASPFSRCMNASIFTEAANR
ncbi:MAG: hypothetical protein JRN16_05495, partial [Nitrososphaerota archaeon]|nr:hypothetical protein [Nitrososphaerota archaeon]